MKRLLAALVCSSLAAVPLHAAPDAQFDNAARRADLAGPMARRVDAGEGPETAAAAEDGGIMSKLGAYKGWLAGGAGALAGGLLGIGLAAGPVGVVGLAALGGGLGLFFMGKSPMEKAAGGGLLGAGMGLAVALALGATPFGWPMLAIAALGAVGGAGIGYFLGGK